MVLIALYPQMSFWAAKGSDWNGAYFVSNFDEVAYSAYVQALISGKPRKYDPYLAKETEHESFYSIQFIPAYSIALPARALGIDASTAFIFLTIFSTALAALFIFWLLVSVKGDNLFSADGLLVDCCMVEGVAVHGEIRARGEGNILVDYMPYLRRYQPGFAFPLFFLFCALVWRSLTAGGRRSSVLYSTLSGVGFGLLVFSYFYLWTAAAAWLAIVYVLNFVWNRDARANLWTNAAIVGAFAAATLIPYFSLIADRSPNIDAIQLLASTHMPDLNSPSMVFGIVVLLAAIVLAWFGRIDLRSPRTLFTLAFAAMPVLLFNQQIITGRSLQPVHYELFIANYVVLVSFVLLCSMLWRPAVIGTGSARKFAFTMAALLAVVWGVCESYGSAVRNTAFADLRDTSIPAIRYIDSLEQQNSRPGSAVVLATNTGTSDMIPTIANLRPLWSSHSSSVGGLGVAENKRLFHHYLVLAGFREHDVADALRGHAFEMTAAFFGSERALPSLGQGGEPITSEEIEEEVNRFAQFRTNFSREAASDPELSYVIVTNGSEPDLTVLDRWYERDKGTVTGPLKVYNVTLRP
jgi:hypothetical protein